MKYIHVLDRERDSYFGSLLHMTHLVEALTYRGYLVAVIDYHHMFEDGMKWESHNLKELDENYLFILNREEGSASICNFWTELEEWVKKTELDLKTRDIFIFSFTTQTDIHDLSVCEPSIYPLKPNLVMSKPPRYPELYKIFQRLDSYAFSEAVIKWFPNNARTDVLSRHKDRKILSERMVNVFELALRESENKRMERGNHV